MSAPGSSDGDVLVIGGGLAGTATAIALARAGRQVTLIERDAAAKHKVCGEFLSAEALELLTLVGVDARALGAVPVHSVRLCSARKITTTALPFAAMSLTRMHLDAALLDRAEAAGVTVLRGTAVQTLTYANGRWSAALHDGRAISAAKAVMATGKHDLRGFPRPPGRQSDLVAMKMYFRLAPAQAAALAGHVELLLHPGGYTGLEPVEGGAANLCGIVRRSVLASLGGGWEALLDHILETCPHARERLTGAEPLLAKPLAVAPIPYGFVRTRALTDHLWAIGDQAAVIPSFTGDGMSIALYSGLRAAESILHDETPTAFQRRLGSELQGQVGRATRLSRALVSAPAKAALVAAVNLWPGLIGWAARTTRLSPVALESVGAQIGLDSSSKRRMLTP